MVETVMEELVGAMGVDEVVAAQAVVKVAKVAAGCTNLNHQQRVDYGLPHPHCQCMSR